MVHLKGQFSNWKLQTSRMLLPSNICSHSYRAWKVNKKKVQKLETKNSNYQNELLKLQVWPFISMSSSPFVRSTSHLNPCLSFTSHLLNPTITTKFFWLPITSPLDVFVSFWYAFHSNLLAFPP